MGDRTEIQTEERKGRLALLLYQMPGAQLDLFYLQSDKLGTPLPQFSARVLASQCSCKHPRAECGCSSFLLFNSLLAAKPLILVKMSEAHTDEASGIFNGFEPGKCSQHGLGPGRSTELGEGGAATGCESPTCLRGRSGHWHQGLGDTLMTRCRPPAQPAPTRRPPGAGRSLRGARPGLRSSRTCG